jgi:dUTPase
MASKFEVSKTQENVILPFKAHGASLGHIIHSLYQTNLSPKQFIPVNTGITIAPVENRIAMVLRRMPDIANKHLEVRQDFIPFGKEIHIDVKNITSSEIELAPYTKLTKLVILKCSGGEPMIVDSLDDTERGNKGFGSTGLH